MFWRNKNKNKNNYTNNKNPKSNSKILFKSDLYALNKSNDLFS